MTVATTTCAISGCGEVVRARGWCHRHYYRWNRNGDPLVNLNPGREQSIEERFWSKVDVREIDECWPWTAYITPKGYGRFWTGKTTQYAYRVAYEMRVGEIPTGLELDHLCHNRSCVNPAHLEPVTHEVNIARSSNALKTHCKRGHEFTSETTYLKKGGGRQCRACDRLRRKSGAA